MINSVKVKQKKNPEKTHTHKIKPIEKMIIILPVTRRQCHCSRGWQGPGSGRTRETP